MDVDVQTHGLRIVAPDNETVLDLTLIQGMWTEEQYLKMTDYSRRLLEFTDGEIEVLPMPTRKHQAISRLLFFAFFAFVQRLGGTAFYAPLRVQIAPGRFREPDLLLLRNAQDPRNQNAYWLGADLVVEIVSPDNPERDMVTKRADYAEAGILEYWIINPEDETIMVLALADDQYIEHGVFKRGEQATSVLLDSFCVDVDSVFDAE